MSIKFLIVIFDVLVGTKIRTPRRIRSQVCRFGHRRTGMEVFSSVLSHLLIFLDRCTGIHAKACYGQLIADFCLFHCYTGGRDAMTNIYRNISGCMTIIHSWKTRFKIWILQFGVCILSNQVLPYRKHPTSSLQKRIYLKCLRKTHKFIPSTIYHM
jgi:hypothetical protein